MQTFHDPARLGAPSASGRYRWVWVLVGLAIIGAAAWYLGPRIFGKREQGAVDAAPGGKAGRGGPVPVVAAKVRKGDIDLYLNGLGTVTALNSVALRSRVDGELLKVDFAEGQTVQAGQLLCQIDPRPFQAALLQHQGQLLRDQALLKDAQANLDRYKNLLKENLSVTQAQVDTQQALVDQYAGAVKTDDAVIEADKLNLEYCRIVAPFTGRIGLRIVDPGNIVHASDTTPLAVITQIQPIAVVFTLAEDDIPKVMKKLDPKHPLVVEALDRDQTTLLATGKLLAVDNQVDPATGTVKLKAVFDNSSNELFPNEFVNGRLRIETLHNAIIVPAAAIQRGPDSIYVYVVKDDKTVDLQAVTVGPTERDSTVVESGLTAGQLVVTDGVDKLQKGAPVTIRQRAAKKKGAVTQPSTTESGTTQPAASHSAAHRVTTQPAGSRPAHPSATQSSEAAEPSAWVGEPRPGQKPGVSE